MLIRISDQTLANDVGLIHQGYLVSISDIEAVGHLIGVCQFAVYRTAA